MSNGRANGAQFPSCRFAPWVGPQYDDGAVAGLRLLVLGESHYGRHESDERDQSLTSRVVTDHLSGKVRHRFIGRVASVLSGSGAVVAADASGEAAFWNAAAFYNYVQEYAGAKARERPTEEAWSRSAPALREVLSELQPQLILVCGRSLWEHVKRVEGLTSDPIQDVDDRRIRSRLFETGRAKAVGGMINHPASFGFRSSEWRLRVGHYVERAVKQKEL